MVFVFLLLLISVTCASALEACPKCGSTNVPYPLSTDTNCGNPKYRVYCNNKILEFIPCRQFEEKVVEGSGCTNMLCCTYLKDSAMTSHRIRVRVGGCTAYTSVVDLKPGDSVESWNYGIELQWLPPN
ncbi:hypothetical protein Acr_19g0001260 [Actinidia rufa]|uniref:Wall-associated receptor kinase galacturonan-binding domain-containing protein n=1 Tax=Actinidia rufa TaxID=165716 RepID=A0A7J0G8S9_9ERIC|nr:hypothetical protein Acr_19g0001260 [Actinidia rufa]